MMRAAGGRSRTRAGEAPPGIGIGETYVRAGIIGAYAKRARDARAHVVPSVEHDKMHPPTPVVSATRNPQSALRRPIWPHLRRDPRLAALWHTGTWTTGPVDHRPHTPSLHPPSRRGAMHRPHPRARHRHAPCGDASTQARTARSPPRWISSTSAPDRARQAPSAWGAHAHHVPYIIARAEAAQAVRPTRARTGGDGGRQGAHTHPAGPATTPAHERAQAQPRRRTQQRR